MVTKWIIEPDHAETAQLAARCGVPPIVAQALLNRGQTRHDLVTSFLNPQLSDLLPPQQLPGAEEAADRMVAAVRAGHRILLYGDYDVDGTTGVAILWHTLRQAGANVSFYVPHRVDEGYGLNLDAVRRLVAEGTQMIVTVDCGITGIEAADALEEAKVPLVVTDHHRPGSALPRAAAIVHPSLDDSYPNPDLCGAGVAFKLAWVIAQKLSGTERVTPQFKQLLLDLLPLAALGTIADVVPLTGENRIIAKHGLARLAKTPWVGLQSLMDQAGLSGSAIDGYDVGFKLAPRINSAGRMGHARLAVELLTGASKDRAREIALYLEEHNRKRQSTERAITHECRETIDDRGLASDTRRAIVLAGEGWHPGVIGIVASRLVDKYHRPVVLISLAGGKAVGSARSIRGYDIHAAIGACSEHLLSFGGHAMAAGVRLEPDRIDAFTEAFVARANAHLTGADLVSKLRLDGQVDLDALTLETVQTIASMGPFGASNPKPRFATDVIELAAEPRCVGRDATHLQAAFVQKGVRIKGIGFGLAGFIEDLKQHRCCRAAFEPMINEFNGRRTVEMQILDLKFD